MHVTYMLEVTYDLIQLLNVLLVFCVESQIKILSLGARSRLFLSVTVCVKVHKTWVLRKKFTTATEWDMSQLPHERNRAK